MKKEEVISCLTNLKPMLKDFEFLLKGMRIKRVPGGQYLVNQVSPPGGVYVLGEGLARAYKVGWRQQTLYLFRECDVIFPVEQPYNQREWFLYVECLEDCVFYYFSAEEMKAHANSPVFREFPVLLREIEHQQLNIQLSIYSKTAKERFDYIMRVEPALIKRLSFYQLASYVRVRETQLKAFIRRRKARLKREHEMAREEKGRQG